MDHFKLSALVRGASLVVHNPLEKSADDDFQDAAALAAAIKLVLAQELHCRNPSTDRAAKISRKMRKRV